MLYIVLCLTGATIIIPIGLYFNESEKFPKKKRIRLFQDFQKELLNLGITTLDLFVSEIGSMYPLHFIL